MKKLFIVCSLMIALIGFMGGNADAFPITGAISFSGTSAQDIENLLLATEFTSFSNVTVSATGGTGDYLPALSGQSVTFNPFIFRPALNPNPLVPLWTFDIANLTYSFDATSLTISSSTSHTISMNGTGIAHITGFDDTLGNWYFSANRAGQTASFSASTDVTGAPVPEPASLLLLGSGLVGLGSFARRKFRKNC